MIDEDQKARLIDFGSCSPIIYCNEFEVKSDKRNLIDKLSVNNQRVPNQVQGLSRLNKGQIHKG